MAGLPIMPSWNVDNYGEPLEATGNYAGDRLGRMRATISFLPIDQETLSNYIERLTKAVYELENISIQSHISGKKMWYTHRTPSQCWICEQINISNYACNILQQLPKEMIAKLHFAKNLEGSLEFTSI